MLGNSIRITGMDIISYCSNGGDKTRSIGDRTQDSCITIIIVNRGDLEPSRMTLIELV